MTGIFRPVIFFSVTGVTSLLFRTHLSPGAGVPGVMLIVSEGKRNEDKSFFVCDLLSAAFQRLCSFSAFRRTAGRRYRAE